jgi:hypothetical protein
MSEDLNKKTKSDVKAILNVMLKRINNTYSFGGWIDFKERSWDGASFHRELDDDFISGFVIQNNQGLVCFIVYAGFTFWSRDNVSVTTAIEKHSPPFYESKDFSWTILKGGDYLLHKKEYCRDGQLTESQWKSWGLNSYLVEAIFELYEHR